MSKTTFKLLTCPSYIGYWIHNNRYTQAVADHRGAKSNNFSGWISGNMRYNNGFNDSKKKSSSQWTAF